MSFYSSIEWFIFISRKKKRISQFLMLVFRSHGLFTCKRLIESFLLNKNIQRNGFVKWYGWYFVQFTHDDRNVKQMIDWLMISFRISFLFLYHFHTIFKRNCLHLAWLSLLHANDLYIMITHLLTKPNHLTNEFAMNQRDLQFAQ